MNDSKSETRPLGFDNCRSLVMPAESALSAFGGRLIEICWLLAVGVVPLLCDPQATSKFLPIKMSLLSSLGIIVAAALAVRFADGTNGQRSTNSRWLIATLLLLASFALATAISIDPGNSLWGGYEFLQGSFALFCQLSLFVGVASCLRTSAQVNRLVGMILAASVPLSLYALYQRFGWDPISFEPPRYKPVSFGGHPSFVAGSLVMAIPLCFWKFWVAMASARARGRFAPYVGVTFLGLLLLIQITALVATGQRGPFVALLACATCAGVLTAVCKRKLRLAGVTLGLTGLVVLGLTALALVGKENKSIRKIPVVGRLSMIVPVGKNTGDVFRKAVWDKAPAVIFAGKTTVSPNGDSDGWWWMRPIAGHGPETLPAVFPQHFFWGGAAPGSNIESRFHNSFWDTMQSAGLLALAAMFWLQAEVFARGVSSLSLQPAASSSGRLLAAGSLLGLVGGLALKMLYGIGFLGLGFSLGFVCGVVLWLGFVSWRFPSPVLSILTTKALLAVALLCAIIAHWVDMAFLFPTPNSSGPAWVLAGALVALGKVDALAAPDFSSRQSRGWPAGIMHGLLAGSLLAALSHAFIVESSTDPQAWKNLLVDSFTKLRHNGLASHFIFLLLIPTWLATAFLLCTDNLAGESKKGFWKSVVICGITSAGISMAWSVWKSMKLAAIDPISNPSLSLDKIISQSAEFEGISVGFLGFILFVALAASLITKAWPQQEFRRSRSLSVVTASILTMVVVYSIWTTQVSMLRSEAAGSFASKLESLQQNSLAADIYDRALKYNPRDPFNRIQASKVSMAIAESCSDPKDCLLNMRKAESLLTDGLRLSDHNVLHYFLGNVLLRQAMEMPLGNERTTVAERARKSLHAAVTYAPDTEVAWFDASLVERELFTNNKDADVMVKRAEGISSKWDPAVWGDQYAYQLATTANPVLRKAYAWRGVDYFTKAISQFETWKTHDGLSRLIVTKGTLLVNLGEARLALDCLLEAAKLDHGPEIWQAHAMLTEIYLRLGDHASAANHVQKAIDKAPTDFRPKLLNLKTRIKP